MIDLTHCEEQTQNLMSSIFVFSDITIIATGYQRLLHIRHMLYMFIISLDSDNNPMKSSLFIPILQIELRHRSIHDWEGPQLPVTR